eukprot:g2669.t1
MSTARVKARQAGFKKGIDGADSRRRRQDSSINIRKQKREEGLAKRRNTAINNFVADDKAAANAADAAGGAAAVASQQGNIPALVAALNATDAAMQTEGARGFRKMLSVEHNPPVQEVIDCGVLPRLISFLCPEADPKTQFEAAWALTNIASTEHTDVIVEAGAVPGLVLCLMSPSSDVREQCAWCLGNVAGDSPELRDQVLATPGALNNLLANVTQPASPSMLRNATWALSNFCRGKPQPALAAVQPCLPVLAAIMKQVPDKEVLMDAGWALSYLSDGTDDRIGSVVATGVTQALLKLLSHDSPTVVTPALRSVGNIVSGSDVHTQAVIDNGGLQALLPLLRHSKKAIRKECCWALSNVAAGTPPQISALVRTEGVLQGVVHQLGNAEWDVKKEAAWVISNVATGGSTSDVRALVASGAIRPVCDLLTVEDAKVVTVALDALEAFLKSGKDGDHADIAQLIDEAEGLDKIEELQHHANQQVYEKAVHLIEQYFGAEDDEENQNIQPGMAEDGSFAFGAAKGTAAPAGGFSFGSTGSFNFATAQQ